MNLKINSLQHIGLPVTDINRSVSFYEKLGFENVMAATFDYNNDKGNVVMMKLNDIIVELYQMPQKNWKKYATGLTDTLTILHLTWNNIDTTFSVLKELVLTVIEPQPVFLAFWQKGCKYFNMTALMAKG
jgi:lactoylglutathione lyase